MYVYFCIGRSIQLVSASAGSVLKFIGVICDSELNRCYRRYTKRIDWYFTFALVLTYSLKTKYSGNKFLGTKEFVGQFSFYFI